MKLNNEIWIRYSSMGCHTGEEIIVEIRKDFFMRKAEGYVFDKEKNFSHWERPDDEDIKELKNYLKKIDFLSLENKYIDPNIMDGGASKFQIYDEPITKEVEIVNFYREDDPYFNQLNKLIDVIYSFSDRYF